MENFLENENVQKETIKDLLYDFVDFGLIVISTEGVIESLNKKIEEITGYNAKELIGTNGEHLFIERKEKERYYDRLRDRKRGISERYKLQILRKDRAIRWVSVFAKPRFNDNDEFIGTISIIEDITDHIQHELVHGINEELTKGVYQYEYDLNGFLGLVDEQIKNVLPVENIVIALGKTNQTIWFPYIRDTNPELQRSEFRTNGSGLSEFVIKSGKSIVLNEDSLADLRQNYELTDYYPAPKSQIVVPIRNGERVIGALRCYSYQHDNLFSDTRKILLERIGERIGSLIDRIKNNIEQRLFIELSGIPVVIINNDGFFEFVNQTFANKLELEVCELMKQPVETLIHPEDKEKFKEIQSCLKQGQTLNEIEIRMVNRNGQDIWFSWFAKPQLTNGSFYFIGRDITQQKKETKANERLNNRLTNLIENLKDGVVFIDSNGIIVNVNNAICEMLGYRPDELIGFNLVEKLHPSHLHELYWSYFKERNFELIDRSNIQFIKKDGDEIWGNLSLTQELDENGDFIGIVGIIADVSKEMEERHRKERLFRLHKSFFTMNEAISRGFNVQQIHQTVLGILHTTYNINVSRIYKISYSQEENEFSLNLVTERMMNKSIIKLADLFPNGIKDLCPKITQDSPYFKVIKEQYPFFLLGRDEIVKKFSSLTDDPAIDAYKAILSYMKIESYALFPIIYFNEAYYLIECVSETKMNEGEVDDLIAFMQQVDVLISKKLVDIDLVKNEKRWRGLIENSSEITCILDQTGKITFASPSVERMLGFDHSQVIHANIFDFLHPEDRPVAEEKFVHRLKEGGMGFYQILRIRNSEGNYKYFRVFTSNHVDKEEINGLIVNAQDITDMITTENEKYLSIIETEENERKRISRDLHDGVGQYLAATNMYMNLLDSTVKDKFDESTLLLFNKTAEILTKATNEVRAVSHNIMPPSLKDFGFVECVKGLVEGLSQGSSNIHFTFEGEVVLKNLPEWVGLTLFRAIQQILSNSITHANPQNISVKLEMTKKHLSIEIKDDGIGFDPAKIDEKEGIGIMSIRHRIQSVGGQTIIQSEPGKGTSFTILISTSTLR